MDQHDSAFTRPLDADRTPLRKAEGGTVRVGNSRITLDLVVEQYENGMSPEDMVRAYDTLDLAEWSLWNDLKILIRTAPVVIAGRGH